MLQRLVEEIRSGGTLEAGLLAQRLGTTPNLVQAMLEHLQRSGYLMDYTDCTDACGGCGIRDVCSKPGLHKIRLWKTADEERDRSEP